MGLRGSRHSNVDGQPIGPARDHVGRREDEARTDDQSASLECAARGARRVLQDASDFNQARRIRSHSGG